MVESSQVSEMLCTKHIFLSIASFLSCEDHLYRLSAASKGVRLALEYSGLTKNNSSLLLGREDNPEVLISAMQN